MADVTTEAPTEPDATPGRRERKKQATRDELMDHAARLFGERGFDAVTTADIAEAADVSQRTFFRHFPSKEAVLYGQAHILREEMLAEFAARPPSEPVVESVIAAVREMATYYESHRDETFLQARLAAEFPAVAAHARATVQSDWEHELTAAIAGRMDVDPLADPRPEILAGAAFAAYRAAVRRWSAEGGRAEFRTLLDDSLAVLGTFRG